MATTKKTTKNTAKPASKTASKPQADSKTVKAESESVECTKRDFLVLTASSVAVAGGAAAAWPFVNSMSPAADVLALSTVEQDISAIEPGQSIKIMWQGKPVFIRRRTPAEITQAQADDAVSLPDPQKDSDRVLAGKEEWLVLVGVCTHLGCIPLGESGDFGGWFCPCHGSHYDTSGRIRKGPAPLNLEVPAYEFISENVLKIG